MWFEQGKAKISHFTTTAEETSTVKVTEYVREKVKSSDPGPNAAGGQDPSPAVAPKTQLSKSCGDIHPPLTPISHVSSYTDLVKKNLSHSHRIQLYWFEN